MNMRFQAPKEIYKAAANLDSKRPGPSVPAAQSGKKLFPQSTPTTSQFTFFPASRFPQFAKFAGVDLLIIDDFGLKPLKASQDEDFHDVISERYERKCTIVTSNLDIPEWTDAFPNKLLGSATIDRLRHGAYTVILKGNSFRAPKPISKIQKSSTFKTPKSALVKGGEIR